jgi:opacity protein-like surface antigen
MRHLSVILVVLLLAASAAAQAPTPTPPPTPAAPQPNDGVHVTAGVSYIKLMDGTTNTVNVTKVDVAVPVTDHFSFAYNQYLVPTAQANVFIGAVRGEALFSQLFKQKPSVKLDLSKFRIYGDIGIGSRHDSISDVRTGFAYALNGGISYNVASNVTFSFGGGLLRAGVGRKDQLKIYNLDTPMIAPGVKLVF